MLFTSLLVLFFSQLFHFAHAANWYTVEWDAPKFTALSGDLVVPKLPQAGGTPYVWPGLQSGNGVLQAVLDGRKGAWWIGDGFYGTPSLPWGQGFSVSPGQTVHFTFQLGNNNVWTCTLSGPGSATTTLTIPNSTMNRAILAVELTNVPFNFGPVIYRNLKITATTAASGWCGKTVSLGYSTGQYTVTGATASGNTCSVSQVTMPSHS
ncbi:hypothetical protein FRC14_005623 [Serendipita sp. 396]|nr:hypothetical protein FRC14_005623 [Serendipita sp. 396]KAG8785340.1 hypothetical protein FRC15_001559 [Serendipita sp. 397]KAG8827075.1 hypothetical protein FRC18_009933 [Serendipita sp. 400]KAG8827326.1 hypothetical protein FRC19_004194 [Serendipita sp. 401]KAG8853867.1 hypothetical protein FRB91_004259 [Serendipita sp. 411]KAG8866941.1 hypothetical protein FRC20_007129 [Serendipita sp. 405]KAG9052528.1 hypothetical protein FS842_009725 [Serendipita sp. 407]